MALKTELSVGFLSKNIRAFSRFVKRRDLFMDSRPSEFEVS
jgi:hypothetical protein